MGRPSASYRDTRPLLQGNANPCRSGLVPRKGRKAAPIHRIRPVPRPHPRARSPSLRRDG
ncbi:hypothetical protein DMX06_07520 [Pseudomonas mosselii]|nr:hypothetical protein DMX06_07520 [Pseudomonas mosselii]